MPSSAASTWSPKSTLHVCLPLAMSTAVIRPSSVPTIAHPPSNSTPVWLTSDRGAVQTRSRVPRSIATKVEVVALDDGARSPGWSCAHGSRRRRCTDVVRRRRQRGGGKRGGGTHPPLHEQHEAGGQLRAPRGQAPEAVHAGRRRKGRRGHVLAATTMASDPSDGRRDAADAGRITDTAGRSMRRGTEALGPPVPTPNGRRLPETAARGSTRSSRARAPPTMRPPGRRATRGVEGYARPVILPVAIGAGASSGASLIIVETDGAPRYASGST